MSISNRFTNIMAGSLLVMMFLLAVFSIRNDTFTFDEVAHVGAGYSYLTQRDYRMNPEHPPLIKDLSAIPLLFLNLNFPKDSVTWTQATPAVWWHQFDFGSQFLYRSGNNPDQILFWSRIPMMLVLIFLGWFLFRWSKKLFGNKAALITVFLFSLSPTFLAHGRFVTTDVGASTGMVLATYFWLKLLKNPAKKSVILAGLFFGIAMIIKFSLILLLPFFGIITLIYAWLWPENQKRYTSLFKYVCMSVIAGIIGVLFIIWPVYQFHVSNYPIEKNIQDAQTLLNTTSVPKPLIGIDIFLIKNPVFRPIGQYALGLLTAMNRTATGNNTYFMGQVSADSWRTYFPVVYAIKEPLILHILTLISVLTALYFIFKKLLSGNLIKNSFDWIKNHFTEFSMLIFLFIYWATSIFSNLNIGIRHILPVFPFTILLTSGVIASLLKEPYLKLKYATLGILAVWQIASVILIYPHFLAYFNELIGGPNNGYKYVVDSNLDWGEDLRRLNDWLNKNGINKIYLDYFGGGDTKYYLGDKFYPWWGKRDPSEFPKGNYLAVSANQLQGGRAVPAKKFDQSCDYYNWINDYPLVAKIGYSIFIYKID